MGYKDKPPFATCSEQLRRGDAHSRAGCIRNQQLKRGEMGIRDLQLLPGRILLGRGGDTEMGCDPCLWVDLPLEKKSNGSG